MLLDHTYIFELLRRKPFLKNVDSSAEQFEQFSDFVGAVSARHMLVLPVYYHT
jgi:hypothetical protein